MALKEELLKARNWAVVALAALIVLWGPEKSIRAKAHTRTPVVFWHMWNDDEWKPVVEGIVKRFNESQTEYEVIPLAIPPADAETKFLLADSGGDPPDLVSQWNPVLGVWSDRKLIKPVEDVMTSEEKARYLREAYPIMRRHAIYKGKIMAVIAGVDISAVYYRLDDLKEVGRDANRLPRTLEELTALGHQLDRRDAQGHLKRIGFLPHNFEQFAPSFGETYPPDHTPNLDIPANRKAIDYIYGEEKKLGFDDVTRFISSQPKDVGVDAPILTGNYSMVLDGQWRVKQIKTFDPNLNYVIGPLPPPAGGRANASYTGPNLLMIPSASKHAAGAWAFMKFWIGFDNPMEGSKNVAAMGWLPYSQKVADCPGYQAYVKEYPKFKTFLDLMPSDNLSIPPQGPLEAYTVDQITQANDSINRGSLTPSEVIERLEKQVTTEQARQRKLGHGD